MSLPHLKTAVAGMTQAERVAAIIKLGLVTEAADLEGFSSGQLATVILRYKEFGESSAQRKVEEVSAPIRAMREARRKELACTDE